MKTSRKAFRLILIDCGRASMRTRGGLYGPIYEGAPPPFTQLPI